MPARPAYKSFLANAALAVVALLFSLVAAEAAYRIYLYNTISEQILQLVKDSLNGPSQFDPETGYHYTPDAHYTNFRHFKDQFRINQYGFMANDLDLAPYPIQKPRDEYRIAVLGDSFANGLQNYIRWPDLAQDYLNRSVQWRTRVGGKYTRVLNFGMDGTGIVQWGKVYAAWASKFEPDLVIVSFITDDIHRRFVYRGQVQFADEPDILRSIKKNVVSKLPWLELRPEVLAELLLLLRGTDHRRLSAAAAYQRYTTTMNHAEAIRDAISALEQIRCLNPNLIILHHPQIEELQVRQDIQRRYPWDTLVPSRLVGLETEFLDAAKQHHIPIVQMADLHHLPSDRLRTAALYNLPIDTHNSDYGVALYAQWVFKFLLGWAAAPPNLPVVSRPCARGGATALRSGEARSVDPGP